MKQFQKVISFTIIITFLLNCLPSSLFKSKFLYNPLVEASLQLTRDEAKKFEGIIASESGRVLCVVEDGTVASTNTQRQKDVGGWRDIVSISASPQRVVGLKSDGTVVATGDNIYGEKNIDDWNQIVSVSAGYEHTVGLRADGTVIAVGNERNSRLNVNAWSNIVSISAGARHTVGLKSDGTVVAVGDNQNRQTNVSSWQNIVAVAAGFSHTVGLKADGTVVAVGSNNYGQTNVSDWKDIVAISAGEDITVGLKADGTVIAIGETRGELTAVSDWKGIVAVSAEVGRTIGLRADGTIVATGNTGNNQKVEGWQDLVEIADSFGQFTVGLKADGTVIATGVNDYGQQDVSEWVDIESVSAGYGHTVGLKKDGAVVAVGFNIYGQTNVSDWKDIVAISAGDNHTVGLKKDGTVVAVGYNYYGQTNVSEWKNIIAISAGFGYTVGLRADGTVVATGGEWNGQTNVRDWKDVIAISAGVNHTVGLKADGTVVSVGSSEYGEGNVSEWKDIIAIQSGGGKTVGLKEDGSIVMVGGYWSESSDVTQWKDIVSISSKQNVLGLKKDGTVVAVGENAAWELNISPLTTKLDGIVSSFDVSKSVGKPGEAVVFTVNFAKKIRNTLKISLRGGAITSPDSMTEVPGSDGKSYQYTYLVPDDVSGKIYFHLSDVTDESDFQYRDIYANNLFVVDGIAPTLLGIENKVINFNSTFDAMDGVGANDNVEGRITTGITVNGNVDTSKLGTYHLTYTATDHSGNSVSKSRIVSVVDVEEPILQGVENQTIMVGELFDPMAGITANDNVDGDITSNVKVVGLVDNSKPSVYTLTYSVIDTSGNTTSVSREIAVVDRNGPVITGATNTTININSSFDPRAGVTAVDNVDGDLTSSIVVSGTINKIVKGIYELTYRVTDSSGNTTIVKRQITVIDNVKPVILGATAKAINMNSIFDPKAGVSANDNVDGNLTSLMKIVGTVNTKVKGIYTLTYSVKDKSGNETIVTRRISVLDNIKPIISGANHKSIYINSVFNAKASVYANDNADGNLTSVIKITGTVNTKVKGTYTLTYSVKDKSGNETIVTRRISVLDNIKPIISGANHKSIYINSVFNAKAGVYANDNADGNLTSVIKITGTVNTKVKGTYILTYRVKDKSGNETVITRKITVKDNIKPVISGAKSKTIKRKATFNPRTGVSAKDNVDGNLTKYIKITGKVNTKKKGKYTLTYSVTDKSGNKAVVLRKIVVK